MVNREAALNLLNEMEFTLKSADVVPLETLLSMSGLDFLNGIIDGSLPPPPMAATLGFHLAEASQPSAAAAESRR